MRDPRNRPPGNGTSLSRRAFLKGSGMAAAGTALLHPSADALAQDQPVEGANQFGPGPVRITLTVNGKEMSTSIEPRVTLLNALRNYLDVTACKKVCDRGTCGACTVLLDGKPIYSCTTLAMEARGKQIQTAEGLSENAELADVAGSFVSADAQQCGFCTPGFVVAIHAVLAENPDATPEDVEKGVSGNICRCGTYEQMHQAIESLCAKKKGGA